MTSSTCYAGPRVDLAEDTAYGIWWSAAESVRFIRERCLTTYNGHACVTSDFVDPSGEPQMWHAFGPVEGPGWGANSVGGAYELYRFGQFTGDSGLTALAVSLLDHVLDDGFIDYDTGFIFGYRNTVTDARHANYTCDDEWVCSGSMARVAHQLLTFSDLLDDPARADRARRAAELCADWILGRVGRTENGWWPRFSALDGSPACTDDSLYDSSGDGLFILDLLADLISRGANQYRDLLTESCEAFVRAGGFFGSINHDTHDNRELVAYAVAFQTLRRAADVLDRSDLRSFAYNTALAGLARFRLTGDRNGVATTGLLYMEDSWDTCYLWENAEAALAYLQAAVEVQECREEYERAGLSILRAIARHHYGDYGFLTEGVDWNNHVGQQHHIDGAEFGAIQYTEPLLNHVHVLTPTLYYVERLARRERGENGVQYRDMDGNLLLARPE